MYNLRVSIYIKTCKIRFNPQKFELPFQTLLDNPVLSEF